MPVCAVCVCVHSVCVWVPVEPGRGQVPNGCEWLSIGAGNGNSGSICVSLLHTHMSRVIKYCRI